ncbi:MAG: hypothetical protein ACE5J6_02225 [Candidatus Bathyarchaeia archaeon]
MPNKSEVTVCPNPKCHRKIEELILLNNLSTTPVERYFACPHCFIKLETDTQNRGDIILEKPESIVPLSPSLEESLDAVSAKPIKEEKKAPVKPSEVEEKSPAGCPHYFGYLTQRPKDAPIPQECLICPKIVGCMLKLTRS